MSSLSQRLWCRPACLLLAGFLALGGCETLFGADDAAFERRLGRMLEVAFEEVNDIYIDPVAMRDLAYAGLGGLRRIAPDLSLLAQDGAIHAIAGGRTLGRLVAPASDDPGRWAAATAELVILLRNRLPMLAAADGDRVLESLFDGMTGALDRFSRYVGVANADAARAEREGFGDIGARLAGDPDGARIVALQPDGPAAAAGLRIGDIISAVDGAGVQGFPARRVEQLLHGPPDRPVRLRLIREGQVEPVDVIVGRTRTVPNTVAFAAGAHHAIIRISDFNSRTAKRVAEAMSRAHGELGPDLQGLIIDLRGNPGGLLAQAVDTADLFLDAGLLLRTQGRHRASLQEFHAEPGDIARGLPIALLIDGGTASAAEILAASLQDHGRAAVIGMSSFGKGTVQTVIALPNGAELHLTWARFIAPGGEVLDHAGVRPGICTHDDADAVTLLDRALADAAISPCPWQPHRSGDIDMAVAELLLNQPALYERATATAMAGF